MELVKKMIRCRCGNTVDVHVPETYFVPHEVVQATGWFYAIREEKSVWLCPSCAEKAKKLAEDLFAIVGYKDILFSCFLK